MSNSSQCFAGWRRDETHEQRSAESNSGLASGAADPFPKSWAEEGANEIVANQTVGNAKSTLDQQRSMPERGTGG
ncbi:uncharacterized protein PgNI_09430 [Pyricularia grisea]|uniref:Uncharacterized protein n=1 Tax=Pyricularia grisea TaxID=148305 RepID=A0A6P8ATL2_PYRGI|nr:uncharacterized protein PgNI_09430 [Pyricularia grisea]TLD05455.1 hypothetical protein PgNI_09430 [Pyricularia grisea]